MYCDFCGKQLAGNVKYCRYCGRMLRDRLDDTMPVPAINEEMLTSRGLGTSPPALSKLPPPKNTLIDRTQIWRIMYGVVSLATIVGMLYILATFETLKQYQILTTIIGSLLAIYTWRKGKISLRRFTFHK